MCGWEEVRRKRHERLVEEGILPPSWRCSPRDEHSPPWEGVFNKEWEDARMACYASQITIMDRGVGRIVKTLRDTGLYHNTVIFFLSDNGGECVYAKSRWDVRLHPLSSVEFSPDDMMPCLCP